MESQLTLNSQWGPIRNVLNLWARFPPEQAERAKIKKEERTALTMYLHSYREDAMSWEFCTSAADS